MKLGPLIIDIPGYELTEDDKEVLNHPLVGGVILFSKNWICFNDIISKSIDDKISLKAALEVSPSFFINGKNKNLPSKIRIVADACFR